MQYDQGSLMTTVYGVQGFVSRNADRLGSVATCGASRKVDELAAKLDAYGREQEARALAAKAATIRRREARQRLISHHMRPIALVAEAEVHNYGELTALHMPPLNVNDAQLIQEARAMATTAAEYADVFAAGLHTEDFVAALERATDELVDALLERVDCVATRQKATAALKAISRVGRLRLRVLDPLVRAAIGNDAALLAEWNVVKRIATKPGPARTRVTAKDIAPATLMLTTPEASPSDGREAA